MLAGCHDDSTGAQPTESSPHPVENPGPVEGTEPELEPLPADLAEPTEEEQLEADCFAGEQAACDRLGH